MDFNINEFFQKDRSIAEILDLHKGLTANIYDLEKSLCALRHSSMSNWEAGIEKDDRYAVQILYKELKCKRDKLIELKIVEVRANIARPPAIVEEVMPNEDEYEVYSPKKRPKREFI